MQPRKSQRHAKAARARWRHAEARAQWQRDSGIPDRAPITDHRNTILLDLTSHGGPRLRIEPRAGYVACRVFDDATGRLIECVALKTALHHIADRLPRRLGLRNTV